MLAVMSDSNEAALLAVIKSWSEGLDATIAATRKYFADDCVWEQPGLPTTTGPEEAVQLATSLLNGDTFSALEAEYRNVVSAGNVVCTERVDWIVKPDGTRLGPIPVVGVTEFRDGKISAWREYADTAALAGILGG